MKFRISTLLLVVTLISVGGAWWVDHRRRELEATQLAAELYRVHTWLRYKATFSQGAVIHPDTTSILLGTGDVLDISTIKGRAEMVQRLAEGDSNFRVKTEMGQVLDRRILEQNLTKNEGNVHRFPGHFSSELYPQP